MQTEFQRIKVSADVQITNLEKVLPKEDSKQDVLENSKATNKIANRVEEKISRIGKTPEWDKKSKCSTEDTTF